MKLIFKKLTATPVGQEKVSDYDFKESYPDVNMNMAWVNVKAYAIQAVRRYILPYLGETLYNDICTKVETGATLDATQQEIVARLRDATAYYVILFALPQKATIVASMGAVQNTGAEGTTQTSQWAFKTTLWATMQKADAMMDDLLNYLEQKNKASSAYVMANWGFTETYEGNMASVFKSGSDFNSSFFINSSHRTFVAMRPIITEMAERHIVPVLCTDLYQALYEGVRDNSLSTELSALLPYVRKALSRWAVFEAAAGALPIIVDQDGFRVISNADAVDQRAYSAEVTQGAIQGLRDRSEVSARMATADLVQFLYDNVDDYPLFKNSPCNKLLVEQTSMQIISEDRGAVLL